MNLMDLAIAKKIAAENAGEGSTAGALAAPTTSAAYDRVPIIKRGELGTEAEDFMYAIATQGASEGTVPLRSQGGSLRGNCSDAIGEAIFNANGADGAMARDQMLVNYGYLNGKMSDQMTQITKDLSEKEKSFLAYFAQHTPVTVPIRLGTSGDKILMKSGHKYYISSDGCQLTNGAGSAYGSFSKTIKDGLITCSTAGYSVGGDGNKNSSTSFRAFVISVSGLSSSSGNMEVSANSCYIENTSGGTVWVYDEGPACDFE